MIQANELRIGNVITHQNNNGIYLVNVIEVLKKGVNVKTGMQLGEWFLRYEEVKGTPLAEDWLFKFGFESYAHFTIPNNKYIDLGRNRGLTIGCVGTPNEMIFLRDISEDGLKIEDIVCLRNFDYDGITHVHQLQNLYFALTGSELVLSNVHEAKKPAL